MSLRRYQKSSVVQKELLKINPAARKVATAVENSIAELLDQPARALALIKPLLK